MFISLFLSQMRRLCEGGVQKMKYGILFQHADNIVTEGNHEID